jgi:hypothetical protein
MEVTDSTKTIVGVTMGHLYDQMYDDARRNSLVEEVGKFTQEMLMDPGIESKVDPTCRYLKGLSHRFKC